MALPAWLNVSVHVRVLLVMVTVPVLIEQPPATAMVTGRPDEAVAATGKVV